jgi:hypothetical protein
MIADDFRECVNATGVANALLQPHKNLGDKFMELLTTRFRQILMVFLVALAAFTSISSGPSTAADPNQAESRTENKLIGTWKMVKARYGGKEANIGTEFKHVTPAHFMLAAIDKDGTIRAAIGGPYTLKGERYEERPEYGLSDVFTIVKGKPQSFEWKVEGNKWYHNGTLTNGLTIEEVWERVENMIADDSKKAEAMTENKLIGTWKMVKAKFDGKEFKIPKGATQLKHITPTQHMFLDFDKDGILFDARGGPYTLKGEKLEVTPEYGLSEVFKVMKGKPQSFVCKVEGNKWYHSGTLSNGLTIEEVWERVE